MTIWKKKSKLYILQQFIKYFNLIIEQCYQIVWSIERKPTVAKTEKEKPMLLLKWAVCGSKISRFPKEQEATGLLNEFFRDETTFWRNGCIG